MDQNPKRGNRFDEQVDGAVLRGSGPGLKDFSSYNREMCQQIDPNTGERVQLLTRKQFGELLLKELKDPELKRKMK